MARRGEPIGALPRPLLSSHVRCTPVIVPSRSVTAAIIAVQAQMRRLEEAIAIASAGYTGIPGTEFEVPSGMPNSSAICWWDLASK